MGEDSAFGRKELKGIGTGGSGRSFQKRGPSVLRPSGSPGREEGLKVQQENLGLPGWGRPREFPSPSFLSSLGRGIV